MNVVFNSLEFAFIGISPDQSQIDPSQPLNTRRWQSLWRLENPATNPVLTPNESFWRNFTGAFLCDPPQLIDLGIGWAAED